MLSTEGSTNVALVLMDIYHCLIYYYNCYLLRMTFNIELNGYLSVFNVYATEDSMHVTLVLTGVYHCLIYAIY